MIVNRNNLNVVGLCKKDDKIPVLDSLLIRKDGATVASSANAFLIISPVEKETASRTMLEASPLDNDVVLSSATVNKILKNLPKDRLFKGLLEHCDISQKDNRVTVATHDGKHRNSTEFYVDNTKYIPYEEIYLRACKTATNKRVILNRSRLKLLLTVLETVFPEDTGDSPLFIDFTTKDELIVRMQGATGQQAIGVIYNYKYNPTNWLPFSQWEESVLKGAEISSTQTPPPPAKAAAPASNKKKYVWRRK